MNYAEESQAAGRHVFPDLARAFALFGIAVVNVGIIAYPMMLSYLDGGLRTDGDHAAHFGVAAFFMLKSYTLFSFMFGVGFAYQMQAAERRGIGFSGRYWRRILGLLAFGLINVAFLFQGDILVMYAFLGSILFLFRKSSAVSLVRWGIGVYAAQVLVVAFLAFSVIMGVQYAPDDMAEQTAEMVEQAAVSRQVFETGSFGATVARRFTEWSSVITFGMSMQGIGALAFFLFGFAAVRHGTIANPAAPIWKRFRWQALPVGLVISATGAWYMTHGTGMMDPSMMIGMLLITIGSPFSTAGYLGLIAKLSEGGIGPVKAFLARGGTASLTAYLLQGLLLSLIFNGYGLGLFGELGAAACIAIAAGVALFTIAFASIWRLAFQRGPAEIILRNWTYLGAR